MKTFNGAICLLPTVCICASALAVAWHHNGSVLAADWLPYAALITLVLAAVLISSATRISRLPLACATLVGCFGLWTGISAIWSPVPSLARDEFLLTSLYGFALALQGQVLATPRSRILAVAIVVFSLGASAVAVAAEARFGSDPSALYEDGRLTAPLSYVNAQSAFFLIGWWPALVLAAQRGHSAVFRACAFAASVAMLAGWLGTQSKGGAIALTVSAVAVFAVVPGRLRLLVPTVLASALVLARYDPLTAPFRDQGNVDVVRSAGGTALVLAAAAQLLGLAYALADNRLTVPKRARRAAAVAVVATATLGAGVAAWQLDRRVDDPRASLADHWESFKTLPSSESGSSHLVSLGSNRYDFWRVSLAGFENHPVAGIGGRGFGPLYLQERRSSETPARAHSLPLDVLLETGAIGFVLLAGAFAVLLAGVARRVDTVAGAAAFGAFAYFAVHATGDWIWTFPAVGLPVFALVGIALASDGGRFLTGRTAVAAAAAVAAFALVAFVPPWLSARVTDAALERRTDVASLRWARKLDPLAIEPYLAEAALARDPAGAVAPLERAVEKQPRNVSARYLLGLAYLDTGRRAEARAQLVEAQLLFPGSEEVGRALARARQPGG